MGTTSAKRVPGLIAIGVLAVVCLLRLCETWWPSFDLLRRMELMTVDWRVRLAVGQPSTTHSNLAAVYLDEGALRLFSEAHGLAYPLPRLAYGCVTRELKAQGARVIAFDMLFLDTRRDRELYFNRSNTHQILTVSSPTATLGTNYVSSDQFFADRMADAGNVILAVPPHPQKTNHLTLPSGIFATNAAGLGHVVSRPDVDGVVRRVAVLRVDESTGRRVWALGITMAAMELGLDLERAQFYPGRITLASTNRPGLERRLPVDADGNLMVDWGILAEDARLLPAKRSPWRHPLESGAKSGTNAPVQPAGTTVPPQPVLGTLWDLFREDLSRTNPARTNTSRYQDAIVLVASVGLGRNVADRGPSPLRGNDFLFTAHWNLANSVLVDRFVRNVSLPMELALITVMVAGAGLLTWRLRALWSSFFVLLAAAGYVWLAVWAYVQHRQLVPLVLPIGGALLMTHVCLVAYRMIFEQAERRRIKSAFSKLVAPDVLDLILEETPESLAGTRRELTVLFADVRNFTGYMDESHARLESQLRERGPAPSEVIRCQDESARHTMSVINEYLSVIAGIVKDHRGTVDKFIGDSVMAFWGAPPPNVQHAVLAVRAAIAAQRAVLQTNADHARENERRAVDNFRRTQAGEPLLPLLPLLQIGVGIHTGTAIAGFMGSRKNISNYTVFGRDVIIANRLENLAEPGSILISEATRSELMHSCPELATRCRPLAPINLKGISAPVPIFQVEWREAVTVPANSSAG